ncbi:hypothetical protein MTR67_002033 [Solanum verrucosum]|uniref:Tf2-1-like SH3-like domain-containing protein n=1 Tax=Solanum verrucosum TaxID=315347 RepID=A0AAF0T8Z9_SOLVR|nr:hypothetical protein MTR67_002033 [Solanum verrucosum]
MVEESTVSEPILEPKPCEKYFKAREVYLLWGLFDLVNGPFWPSGPTGSIAKVLTEESKEGFKDGGKVHGKVTWKGSRTVEESTVSEPILEPKPSKKLFKGKSLRKGSRTVKESMNGKLSTRYVVPYQILRRNGKVATELELPSELALVHPVFHVSLVKKSVGDATSIVPLEGLGVKENLSYEEIPVEILDRQVKKLRNNEIVSVKDLWRNQLVVGATWEAEADMIS